jgi:hypothetical protein
MFSPFSDTSAENEPLTAMSALALIINSMETQSAKAIIRFMLFTSPSGSE